MDLVLEARTGKDSVTLLCHGKLVNGKEAETFRSSARLLVGGFENVTIDMAGVRAMDAGGLGSLEAVLALGAEKHRHVQVTNASASVREMLKASKVMESGKAA